MDQALCEGFALLRPQAKDGVRKAPSGLRQRAQMPAQRKETQQIAAAPPLGERFQRLREELWLARSGAEPDAIAALERAQRRARRFQFVRVPLLPGWGHT